MDSGEKTTFVIARDSSPWRGFTSSHAEEEANRNVVASDLGACVPVPSLAKYDIDGAPLLGRDEKKRRVFVNARFFTDLIRADATRVTERTLIGTLRETAFGTLSCRMLAAFLLESQIVITYWHVEAELVRSGEFETDDTYTARLTGTHTYFTNEKNTERFDFTLEIDKKNGEMYLCPPARG